MACPIPLASAPFLAPALVVVFTVVACNRQARNDGEAFCREHPDDSLCGRGEGRSVGGDVLDPVEGFPGFRVGSLPTKGAPSARHDMAYAWTGSALLVAGGRGEKGALSDGARYDAASNTWKSMAPLPEGRAAPHFAWTGTELIVWGGTGARSHDEVGGPRGGGWRYDPTTDAWSALGTQGEPTPRLGGASAYDGRMFVVWGGRDASGKERADGARYDPATGTWSTMATGGAPSARDGHSLTATARDSLGAGGGGSLLLFGGRAGGTSSAEAFLYDSGADAWTPVASGGAPGARFGHAATTTDGGILIYGGAAPRDDRTECASDGGLYDAAARTWTSLPETKAPPGRGGAALLLSGVFVFAYGGQCGGTFPLEGGVYAGDTGQWTPKRLAGRAGGFDRGAWTWTGDTLLLWGGLISRTSSTAEGTRVVPGKPGR